jgi:hypothetical protein
MWTWDQNLEIKDDALSSAALDDTECSVNIVYCEGVSSIQPNSLFLYAFLHTLR